MRVDLAGQRRSIAAQRLVRLRRERQAARDDHGTDDRKFHVAPLPIKIR
jgi:hypothetical protein